MVKHKQPGFKYVQIMVGFSWVFCYVVLPISYYFLLGVFPTFLCMALQITSAVVLPGTAVDCVVSLCQFTKGLHNTEAA